MSPSKSRKMLLPGMVESTWRTLPVGEKIAWVKEVKESLAKLEVKIDEERRRSPFSMAAAAPPGPSTATVPSSMLSSSSHAIVKNEDDAGPPSSNLRSRNHAATPRAQVGMSVHVRREVFSMWLRSASP